MPASAEIMLYVEDPKRSAAYWTDVLGFRDAGTRPGPAGTTSYLVAAAPGDAASFVLMDRKATAKVSPEVSLVFPSILIRADDIAKLRQKIDEAGFWTSDIVEAGSARSFSFQDPDGNYLAAMG